MDIMSILDQMERGQYSLSIGTSLAFESLANIHPELKHKSVPHKDYTDLWVNLKTLARNIVQAFPAEINHLVTPGVLCELLTDEWKYIEQWVRDNTRMRSTLYVSSYKDLERRYNTQHSLVRRDSTDKQKADRKRVFEAIQLFMAQFGQSRPEIERFMKVFDTEIECKKEEQGKVLILTHIPFDLIRYKSFGSLDLLESHTGAIKNRSLWYTKYLNGKDLSMIPFTLYFMRVFGDKETFAPMDIKLRKEIIALAQADGWSAITTDARVRFALDKLKNPYYRTIMRELMSKS